MQPINLIKIYYWDKRNDGHLNKSGKKNAVFELDIKSSLFLIGILSASRTWYLFF